MAWPCLSLFGAFKAVSIFAGRRFFVLSLRGGSSPCDLLFACVLRSSLVCATLLRFARHLVPSFVPRCSLAHVCACAVVGFFAGRRFFALCSRGGSSPCSLLFAGELCACILPSPFPVQRVHIVDIVAWITLLLGLLVFPLGAASSRWARAAIPRPSFCCWCVWPFFPLCLLLFRHGRERPLLRFALTSVPCSLPRSGSAVLVLLWCFQSCWYFCWAPLLRAQPARRFFALPPTPCCLLPTALRPLLPTSHQLCLGSWLCLCSCWRFCWAPLLHGLLPRLFFALPVFSAYLG